MGSFQDGVRVGGLPIYIYRQDCLEPPVGARVLPQQPALMILWLRDWGLCNLNLSGSYTLITQSNSEEFHP